MSVRRQALDLVFAMCDQSNAKDIVGCVRLESN